MPQQKQNLKLWQMVNLNIGLLGIQFAWSLAIANMSGIYTLFGAKNSDLGYLWLAPSFVGLVIPPLIGYLSDRTSGPYGKRLPFIFIGVIFTACCLFAIPNSQSLTMVAILLCIFSATINGALQPYRPLVADIVPAKQHTWLYSMQAGFIGIGAALASIAPWIFSHYLPTPTLINKIPMEIRLAFYCGAITILITNLWTSLTCKPYVLNTNKAPINKSNQSLKQKLLSFCKIPRIMRQVSYVQFFTWLGVFCFIVYLTPTIENTIFHISQTAHLIHNSNALIEKSTVLTGIACAIYMAANIIVAYLIPVINLYLSRKKIHMIALIIGAISLASLRYIHHENTLFIAMIGIGISWASFNSIPFSLIASKLSQDKIGYYMGVFNVAICLPQIIVSIFAGVTLKNILNNNTPDLMIISGISFIIAALLLIPIKDTE